MSYDVTEVTLGFLRGVYGTQRNDLVNLFGREVRENRALLHMISEVGHEAASNDFDPVNSIALGLMYGMVLGVLLEQERAGREKVV